KKPDPMLWGTARFAPTISSPGQIGTGVTQDQYSLGAILYLLITGRMFDSAQPISIGKHRRNVPLELQSLVEILLSDDPQRRPSARSATSQLNSILRTLTQVRKSW